MLQGPLRPRIANIIEQRCLVVELIIVQIVSLLRLMGVPHEAVVVFRACVSLKCLVYITTPSSFAQCVLVSQVPSRECIVQRIEHVLALKVVEIVSPCPIIR